MSWLKYEKMENMEQDLYSYRNPKAMTLDSMLRIVFLGYAIANCVGMAVWFGEVGQKVGLEIKKVWGEVKVWVEGRMGKNKVKYE